MRARNAWTKAAAEPDYLKELRAPSILSIGDYRLGRTIGEGTYGKVKAAFHKPSGEEVAIKITDKMHAPIVEREIETWRRLRHPYIAQLYEVIIGESKIYMVTELARGGELFDYVRDHSPLEGAEAKRIFRQLLLAMQHCHDKNFVHRDLKLENVLLDEHRNVKLIDFGFTKEYENKPGKLMQTFCGSSAYAAPEMIVGQKYTGPEADIWSLGIILFALVCGYLPFDDEMEARVHAKIKALDYELPEGTDEDAKDLICSVLRIEPKERVTIEQMLKHRWFDGVQDDSRINAAVTDGASLVRDIPKPLGQAAVDGATATMQLSATKSKAVDHATSVSTAQQAKAESLGADEKTLMHRLTLIGYDTLALVDSITDFRCDTQYGMFYLLLRKMKRDRRFYGMDGNGAAMSETTNGLPLLLSKPPAPLDLQLRGMIASPSWASSATESPTSEHSITPLSSIFAGGTDLIRAPAAFDRWKPTASPTTSNPDRARGSEMSPTLAIPESRNRSRKKKQTNAICEEDEEEEGTTGETSRDDVSVQSSSEQPASIVNTTPRHEEGGVVKSVNAAFASKSPRSFGRDFVGATANSTIMSVEMMRGIIANKSSGFTVSSELSSSEPESANMMIPSWNEGSAGLALPVPDNATSSKGSALSEIDDNKDGGMSESVHSAPPQINVIPDSPCPAPSRSATVTTASPTKSRGDAVAAPLRRLYHSGAQLGIRLGRLYSTSISGSGGLVAEDRPQESSSSAGDGSASGSSSLTPPASSTTSPDRIVGMFNAVRRKLSFLDPGASSAPVDAPSNDSTTTATTALPITIHAASATDLVTPTGDNAITSFPLPHSPQLTTPKALLPRLLMRATVAYDGFSRRSPVQSKPPTSALSGPPITRSGNSLDRSGHNASGDEQLTGSMPNTAVLDGHHEQR